MKHWVRVTKGTLDKMAVLSLLAGNDFDTSTLLPTDSANVWLMPLSTDVYNKLLKLRGSGETMNDCIERLLNKE